MTKQPVLTLSIRRLLVVWGACLSLIAFGDEIDEDTKSIRDTIPQQWNRPEQAVDVFPIAVSAPYALAGWQQGNRGGHALLYHEGEEWLVLFCGGQALTSIDALKHAGLNDEQAGQLIQKWREASSGLAVEKINSLNSFEGIVPVNGQSSHEHHH